MKHEYRKHERALYCPKNKPELVQIPKQKFFCIKGKGNPNNKEFIEKVGVLYSLAYAIRMMPKKGIIPDGYFEYTVYPLEGIWDLTEKGRLDKNLNKDELLYTIMIRQPEFVTLELVKVALEIVTKKKPNPLLKEVYFEEIEDGLSVQIMHEGSYDSEVKSFNKMKEYIEKEGLEIKSLAHREIYLSDARRVKAEKLKTVLRYRVSK